MKGLRHPDTNFKQVAEPVRRDQSRPHLREVPHRPEHLPPGRGVYPPGEQPGDEGDGQTLRREQAALRHLLRPEQDRAAIRIKITLLTLLKLESHTKI